MTACCDDPSNISVDVRTNENLCAACGELLPIQPATSLYPVRPLRDSDTGVILLEPRGQYDSCLLGVTVDTGFAPAAAVYDEDAVLHALAVEFGSEQDAKEWYGFNILGAHLGPSSPLFVRRP